VKSLHDGETGSLDDGKVLVGEVLADGPRGFQIRHGHGLDQGDASSKAVPEPVGGHPAQAVP
jgi:hypothetical protein